jgi:amino acid transporter
MTEQKTRTFVRDSTGLVKNVSFLDAVSLNISNMSAGAALATISFTTFALPPSIISGLNLAYAAIFAFVLSIPQIVVYTMMTRRLPRTGGDYVWVSRTFGGFLGSSLSFMGYTLETLAFLALIAISAAEAIGSVGVAEGYNTVNLATLPIFGGDALSQFVLAAVIFALLIVVNIFKPKAGYKLVSVFAVVGVIALIVAILNLLVAGHSGVVNYAQSLATANSNSNLTYSSIAGTYTGPTFNLSSIVFVLPFFAIFVFPWLNAAPAVGSEIKGKSSIRWNIPVSSLIVFVLVTGAFATMYYAGGFNYITGALTSNDMVNFYTFNFWTLSMGVASNSLLSWFIGIGWILWEFAILAYGIIVFSRYLFAQAFDRFLPSRISYVSHRYGSPAVAHVIDLVITVCLIGAASFLYGSFSTLYAAVVAAMIYFFFVGLAAVVYATRKEKGSAKVTLSIAGILMAIVFAFISYQFFTNPTIWGTANLYNNIPGYYFAYIYVAASFIVGAAIYLASKSYHKSRGIDISLAYKEIPPD